MNHARLRIVLPLLLVALLLCVATWSVGRLFEHRRQAAAAAQETARCIQLAQTIEQLRRAQTLTGGDPLQSQQLQQIIQQAASRAGIDPNHSIRSIRPRPGQRLGKTPYIEHAAELKLQDVSRRQLVAFMHALMEDNPGLGVRSLRMSAATDDSEDRWVADPLTLTYLNYQPTASRPARSGSSDRSSADPVALR